MKVRTPASTKSSRRFIRTGDLLGVFLAAPIAIALRDPSIFSVEKLEPTLGYCVIGFGAGLLMVIVFHLGQSLGHFSAREAGSVVAASLATTALNTVCTFSLDRLDYIPRSLPLIQFLVLCALMLGGRAAATRARSFGHTRILVGPGEPHNVLLVGANAFALSYLRMLDAFNVDRSNIVAILDRNPKLFGRALLGHPIIGPPVAIMRVIHEYKVHGVDVAKVLICENRPSKGHEVWNEIEEYRNLRDVEIIYLSDVLGFKFGETAETKDDDEAPEVGSKDYRLAKRVIDLSMSVALAIAISPVLVFVSLGIVIDLGWPIIFWQRRIGYHGRPFLIFKFRTLHAPYDRQGNFVEEDRRTSRFGSFLRRTRLDELPQLWNIVCDEMSFVGPRPLLPLDQPADTQPRLRMKPGVTGWAQINGGKQITAREKGLLDEWYVRRASLWLDLRIIMRTFRTVLFGDEKNVLRVKSAETTNRWPNLLGRDASG